jgi:hypothetical protein
MKGVGAKEMEQEQLSEEEGEVFIKFGSSKETLEKASIAAGPTGKSSSMRWA